MRNHILMFKKFFVIPFYHSIIPIYNNAKHPMTEPK
ncbi:hypothetical protein SAMN05216518_12225 [Bacteroidales bacterium KHT7]|nr:hypothetical protein SAMN05216518_12225 [Bacteroidales bacterium KHT7]